VAVVTCCVSLCREALAVACGVAQPLKERAIVETRNMPASTVPRRILCISFIPRLLRAPLVLELSGCTAGLSCVAERCAHRPLRSASGASVRCSASLCAAFATSEITTGKAHVQEDTVKGFHPFA